LLAAEAEAETIRVRWSRMIDGNGNSALNLESLLRAQERVALSERDYVTSMLTYNLAMIHLKKTNGTLLQSRNVVIDQVCDRCEGPSMTLDMAQADSVKPQLPPRVLARKEPESRPPTSQATIPQVVRLHVPSPQAPGSSSVSPQLTSSLAINPKAPLQRSVRQETPMVDPSLLLRSEERDSVRTAVHEQSSVTKYSVVKTSMETEIPPLDIKVFQVKNVSAMNPLQADR
jgi:hypothetical protein